MAGGDDKQALASAVWQSMLAFFMSTRRQRDSVLERLGLTPNDAKALASLSEDEGRTMRSLAGEWACDASNATWVVDRLENRGFAARREFRGDRRVKLVFLTPSGAAVKQDMLDGMHIPPPELLTLSRADLTTLKRTLIKLSPTATHEPLATPGSTDRSVE